MSIDILSRMNNAQAPNQTLSGTTANASQAIDMQGYEGLAIYLRTHTVTDAGTAAGFTMRVQHSNTLVGADFVDCTADQLVPDSAGRTTLTVTDDAADDTLVGGVGYRGGRRYVRTITTGTTGTNAVVNVNYIRSANSSVSAPVATTSATLATT